jgi:hypothetical protein
LQIGWDYNHVIDLIFLENANWILKKNSPKTTCYC